MYTGWYFKIMFLNFHCSFLKYEENIKKNGEVNGTHGFFYDIIDFD